MTALPEIIERFQQKEAHAFRWVPTAKWYTCMACGISVEPNYDGKKALRILDCNHNSLRFVDECSVVQQLLWR